MNLVPNEYKEPVETTNVKKQQMPLKSQSWHMAQYYQILELKMENNNSVKSDEINSEIAEIIKNVELIKLDENAKLKDVIAKLNEVIEVLNTTKSSKVRDRGPESQREMVEDDARRILLGDMKDKSHKDAAKELGLSYGQIYSARKGFTFKSVYKEWRDLQGK